MIARSFKITPELIYLFEALKVEGYWSLKHPTLVIQNKNLPFLEHIEKIVKSQCINVNKRVLIKIKPVDSFAKKDVLLTHKGLPVNFHIEISPFDGSKKIVTILPYEKKYKLFLKMGSKSFLVIIEEGEEEISVFSELKGWAYLDIRFSQINFLRLISNFQGSKKDLRLSDFLLKANKEYVAAAFSALIDSEGSINHYGFFRKIRIRMRSKNYLEDWRKLLNKFNVHAALRKNNEKEFELCIEGREDFISLTKLGLQLYQSKRLKKWNEILCSYKRNQVSRNSAYAFYIKKLEEIEKPVTAREFALKINKNKRTVSHYLTLLMRKNLIDVDKSHQRYKYSIKRIAS